MALTEEGLKMSRGGGGEQRAVIASVFTVAIKTEVELMRSSLTFLRRGDWGSH